MAVDDRQDLKSAQRQWLVKVHGVQGLFMTKSGGSLTSSTTKVYDGGRLRPSVLSSPPEVENITVTRAYRTHVDDRTLRELRRVVGEWRTDITVTPTNTKMEKVGRPTTYPRALLVAVTEPDVDSASGDPGIWSLEFAVPYIEGA